MSSVTSSPPAASVQDAAPATAQALPDLWTLVAVSAIAYILSLALHEHGGHTAACVLLGGRPLEMGAFYVNCDYSRLSALDIRLVAIAGSAVDILLGLISFAVLSRLAVSASAGAYFFWLLGTLGLMEGTGYLLFSGVSGLGDLGFEPDGALAGASPVWLWQAVLALSGALLYLGAVYFSLARIEPYLSGEGRARLSVPRRAALISYLVGVATYVIIGAFNPYGLAIVLISVLPSAMGGASGLLWMFQLADRHRSASGPGLSFGRRAGWIVLGLLLTLAYGLVFARTLHFPSG